ncbi:MAG: glycosyltransferase [Caldimonas sp.]
MIPFVRTPQGSGCVPTVAAPARDTVPPEPRISVVIPTFKRPDLLARCLAAVVAQRFDPEAFEVIVVDDGHTADTQAVVDSFRARTDGPVVRFVRPRNGRGPAVARNAGWRAAYGPVIAFTDDDTIPDRHWLANGERALKPGVVGLCGRVEVPRTPARGGRVDRPTDHELMTRGLESAEFVTANAFVRRGALLTVGGFDERFKRAWREDSDLQFRLMRDAGPIGRSDDAVVVHPVRPERWGVCLRQQKNSFFDALLYKKHPTLYRERIFSGPPWNYYAIVALTLAAPALLLAGVAGSAIVSLLLAGGFVLRLAAKRLGPTARTPEHVVEMVATSALIPFLSVYWRLRGAIHFRVLFL